MTAPLTRSPRIGAIGALALSLLAGWLVPWASFSRVLIPDLPLLTVIAIATRLPREQAMVLAAATGLLADAFSAVTFGSRAMVFVTIAWLAGSLSERINPGALPARLVLTVGGVLGGEFLGRLVAHLLDPGTAPPASEGLLARAAATALVAVFLWRAPRPVVVGRAA